MRITWFRRPRLATPIVPVVRDFVTLPVGHKDFDEDVNSIRMFMLKHQGDDHVVKVAVVDGKQKLFCSCGLPRIGDLSHGTLEVAPTLREEDLFDTP